MLDIIREVKNVKAVEPFDYEPANRKWVTNPDIAQRLAKTIVCYSRLYGNKRIVLVTHSMGGLVAREAEDWAAYGTFARNVTGRIITIAAPHTGSRLANIDSEFWVSVCKAPIAVLDRTVEIDALCRQAESGNATSGLSIGSDQLANLPRFPPGVSVKAIAGDARWQVCAPWGCSVSISTGGDLVVGISSATDEYTSKGTGDGKAVFSCDTTVPVPSISPAWCEHSKMLQAPQVQQEVKTSIEKYLLSANKPRTYFYGLGLQMPFNWKVAKNNQYISYADDSWTVLYDSARCSNPQWPEFCPTIIVVNLHGPENKDPYGDSKAEVNTGCYWDHFHDDTQYSRPRTIATINIGGEKANYQQQKWCSPDPSEPGTGMSAGTLHAWRIPSRSIVVFTSRTDDETVRAAQNMLRGAAWV